VPSAPRWWPRNINGVNVVRQRRWAATIRSEPPAGILRNEHIEGDGDTVFRHACGLGLEGIVSKRKLCLPVWPFTMGTKPAGGFNRIGRPHA